MTLVTEILDSENAAQQIGGEWDELSRETARPFCAPAWMMAWWRHARPAGAGLRIVTVVDSGRLIGLAPFWVVDQGARRSAYEVLAGRLSAPAGPLAVPGREDQVAAAVATALAAAEPRPSMLWMEDVQGAGGWTGRLADAWPGRRPWLLGAAPRPLPTAAVEGGDYDTWLGGKSSKFRQETRRLRRRIDDAGASFEIADPDRLERAIAAFAALNGERWKEQGGSNALVPGVGDMLIEAAVELAAEARLRIFTLEVGGRIVAVNIVVAAGTEASGWNSGFDPEWSKFSPSLLLTLHALADAIDRGETRFSLGAGGASYKMRLADEITEVTGAWLVPRGLGYPLQRARLEPKRIRIVLSERLSADSKRRLRGLVRR